MLACFFVLRELDLDLAFLKRTWTCPINVDLDLRTVDLDLTVAGLQVFFHMSERDFYVIQTSKSLWVQNNVYLLVVCRSGLVCTLQHFHGFCIVAFLFEFLGFLSHLRLLIGTQTKTTHMAQFKTAEITFSFTQDDQLCPGLVADALLLILSLICAFE